MIGHFSMQQRVTNQQVTHHSGSCLTTSNMAAILDGSCTSGAAQRKLVTDSN